MGGIELENGAVFAEDYRVVAPLRRGGMGAVYVVEQLSTSKRRALKLMAPALAERADFRRRFALEAHVGARIASDHVVEVIASGVEGEARIPWLVMELLEGQDLGAWLRQKGTASLAETREVFAQLCHALTQAHAQMIVHRDLKPENIFMADARRRDVPFTVKILDFGIARIVADLAPTSTSGNATESSLGTPLYMAPEQAEAGAPISPATDVWPLGLLAFELLTGKMFWRAAHENPSVLAVARETLIAPLPLASARAAQLGCADLLPAGFDGWFARCVARDAGQRYANAALAFAALEPLLGGDPVVSATGPRIPSVTPARSISPAASTTPASMQFQPTEAVLTPLPPRSRVSRRRLAIAAAAGAVLLVGAVLGAVATRASDAGRGKTAAGPNGPSRAGAAEWRPTDFTSTGVPDCDEYLRWVDCQMRAATQARREAYLKQLRENLMTPLKYVSSAVVAQSCREAMKEGHEGAKAAGCAR